MHNDPQCPRYGYIVTGHLSPCTCWERDTAPGYLDRLDALDALPVNLTVYGPNGSVTVRVREDSIEVKDGNLIAEGTVEDDKDRLFTFPNVLGYSTAY